jgi:hypothetical protein
LQQESEADRISSEHCLNPMKTSRFEDVAVPGQRKANAVLLRYSSEVVAAIFLTHHRVTNSNFAISFT